MRGPLAQLVHLEYWDPEEGLHQLIWKPLRYRVYAHPMVNISVLARVLAEFAAITCSAW